MGMPTRFPSGLNNSNKNSALSNLTTPDPTKVFTYFQDFNNYVAAEWTLTQVAGTGTCGSVVADPFGSVVVTNSGADNDETQLLAPNTAFTLSSGKKAWFKTRIKVSDATESDWLVGLAILDTRLWALFLVPVVPMVSSSIRMMTMR